MLRVCLVASCWATKTRLAVAGQPLPLRQDVRGLRVVKEAMRTGINVLFEKNELAAEKIDQVISARTPRS